LKYRYRLIRAEGKGHKMVRGKDVPETKDLADLLEKAGYGVTRGRDETLAKIKELGEAKDGL